MVALTESEPSPLAAHASTPAELRDRLEAERDGEPFLVFRDDSGEQRIHPVSAAATRASVGRSPGNDVALPWDEEASRLHAELERIGDEWTVSDDGLSRNGTWLNGDRVVGRARLRDGDVLRVGRTMLAFRVPDPADSRATVVAGTGLAPQLSDTQRRVVVALCRPLLTAGGLAAPATNAQVAEEVFLSVDAVKTHLRGLFAAFGLEALPQNQKRSALAARALAEGLVGPRDLA